MTEVVCRKHSPSGLSTDVGTCESGTKASGGGGDGVSKETTGVSTSVIFLFFSRASAVAVAIKIFGPVKQEKVCVPPGYENVCRVDSR